MAWQLDTKTQTFLQIMGNGLKYHVPKFQRDYAWGHEQWEDLWNDLTEIEDGDKHYLGYLVFQAKDSRTFAVIDGQQRLTTISILILAILHRLQDLIEEGQESEDNRIRLDTLRSNFIGFTDPVSLKTRPKLKLNRNNDGYFRRYLCELQPAPVRGVKRSEKLLGQARAYFDDRLGEKSLDTGEKLAAFVEAITDRILFTTITVGSDLNAYKVFETLNARGVQLSVPDLVKNYLFSIIDDGDALHEKEIDDLEESWGAIIGQLGQHDFTKFIHAEWNSRHPLIQKNGLFKRIKRQIEDRGSAHAYLRKLEQSAETYAALQSADDPFWDRPEYKGARDHVAVLRLFGVTQPTVLLLAAYDRFSPERFVKILSYVVTISIRFNVFGAGLPAEQERAYNRTAQDITKGTITNLDGLKRALRGIYVSDDEFLADFRSKRFRTTQSPKKSRYLLAQLEREVNPGLPLEAGQLSLEHILPKNPGSGWGAVAETDFMEEALEMLGNMTLLSPEENRLIGNTSFDAKKSVFRESSLAITRKVCDSDVWDKDAVMTRQDWFAGLAIRRWRIDYP